jgi:tetratricopeptide (TPR) repeat protein
MWKKKPSPELATALGELYFRRGVRAVTGNPQDDDAFLSGIADLERAGELLSGDERPLYHLGLAHHRRDDLREAQAFYQRVLELRPDHRRAAYHLALTALEQQSDPAQSLGWTTLTSDQQADVQAAWYLLGKQSKRLREADDLHPTWTALTALDGWRADKRRAREKLDQVLAREDDDAPRSRLARIYLGNLLWSDDPSTAARYWYSAVGGSTEKVHPAPAWTERNRAVGADFLACHHNFVQNS